MADKISTKSRPKLPFLTRLKLLILGLVRHVYIRRDGTINRRVLRLLDSKASAPATKLIKGTRVSTSDVPIDPSRDLWFRLFVPADGGSGKLLPLIVYFHGGGFTNFGPDSQSFDDLCSRLAAEAPAVVASVNYRLAPEHRYPCQYEDGFDALKFINTQNYAVLPATTDLSKCFIAGDSAGGNIAHHVTFRACRDRHELDRLKIIGLVGLQPFFGGEERTESELRLTSTPMLKVERTDWMWRCFLPEGADRNHPAAHVFGDGPAAKDLKNIDFPKVLVIKGGYDPLQDWQERYAQWLKNCGKTVEVIEYPNAFHGFYGFPEVPGYDLLISDVAKFIQEQAHCS
ncbi:UNVERIFIED_CONTAM: putative carboxylesterase 18 [Sesamum angustifolium]|uniref:Carboxylesterase 18 n=1 Tax=Sesamum angustifolium TaxID=2727405 RepID=A0AAW2LEU0_9LAMI